VVAQLTDNFFVQFTGIAEPGGGTGSNNLFTTGDGTTYAEGDLFSTPTDEPRYLAHKTDFRAVLTEIAQSHFGLAESALDDVIPGYSELTGDAFDPLGIL